MTHSLKLKFKFLIFLAYYCISRSIPLQNTISGCLALVKLTSVIQVFYFYCFIIFEKSFGPWTCKSLLFNNIGLFDHIFVASLSIHYTYRNEWVNVSEPFRINFYAFRLCNIPLTVAPIFRFFSLSFSIYLYYIWKPKKIMQKRCPVWRIITKI